MAGFGGKGSLYQAIVYLLMARFLYKIQDCLELKILTELIQIQIQVIYYSDQPINIQYSH